MGATDPTVATDPADQELIMFLERDQFVADTSQPLARAPLGGWARAALWGLRAYVALVSLMVVYTFVSQLQ